jgi:hypothetical protein
VYVKDACQWEQIEGNVESNGGFQSKGKKEQETNDGFRTKEKEEQGLNGGFQSKGKKGQAEE